MSDTTYHPPRLTSPSPEPELEPTTAELAAAFKSSQAARERLVGGPLMTKAMRDAQAKPPKTYDTCRLRVKFGDGSLFQATFSATQTMADVHGWFQALIDSSEYELFTPTPKRVVYDAGNPKSLFELGLCPASILSVSFLNRELNTRAPVREEWKGKAEPLTNYAKELNEKPDKEKKMQKLLKLMKKKA